MGSKLLNAYIIVRINALRVASAPVLTNTPIFLGSYPNVLLENYMFYVSLALK